jgi:uncharacterized membrane protein YbaN (DUF454 family)
MVASPTPHDSPIVRTLCLGGGILSLILAIAGIFLPLLPTTPFILLAAGCFARSSTRIHDWLLAQRIAGPIIREWHEHRSMPPGVKPWAFALISVSFGLSMFLMTSPWHRAMLLVLAGILALLLWRVPVRNNQ